MNIKILLPYKEQFTSNKASAVSLTVKNSLEYSNLINNIKVYGRKINNPFFKNNYEGLVSHWILHGGHNKSLAYSFCKKIILEKKSKILIEIHNRPYIFHYIKKKLPQFPITLHFHNDPTTMKGSKTEKERKKIAHDAAAIYCVSKFIKNRFLEKLNFEVKNLYVLNNGIKRKVSVQPVKKKEVLFVGRIVFEKGAHLFADAIKKIINNFPDWNFNIIGASRAGEINLKTDYEKNVINQFKSLGSNTNYYGFLDNEIVQRKMQDASIVVVPSIWDDPFPLVAIEALCNGAALIASDKGGLPEIVENNGLILNNINIENLAKSLNDVLADNNLLKNYQNKSWNNYNFDIKKISEIQDQIRLKIIKDFYN